MSTVYDHMTKEYGIEPDVLIDLRVLPKPEGNTADKTMHRHALVILDDGSELWLDIGGENRDHNFIDVRWFNTAGAMKGIGAFTIVNGSRQSFGSATVKTDGIVREAGEWRTYKQDPLTDTEGTPVTGHKWNGGYCVTLLVDKNGEEAASHKPSPGNG